VLQVRSFRRPGTTNRREIRPIGGIPPRIGNNPRNDSNGFSPIREQGRIGYFPHLQFVKPVWNESNKMMTPIALIDRPFTPHGPAGVINKVIIARRINEARH
jgi:hypothetical protein